MEEFKTHRKDAKFREEYDADLSSFLPESARLKHFFSGKINIFTISEDLLRRPLSEFSPILACAGRW